MALVRPVRGPLGRTDMGVDIGVTPGDPVVAIAPSEMVGIIRDWFQGQPFGWFRVLSGPFAGKYWYAAEQIDFSAKPGQRFAAGERIGTIARSGTATEFGWATRSGSTLAQATTGYTEGQVTRAGRSFRAALMGATAPGDMAWQPCTLTWYDPALGGTNSSGGQADPHSKTSSGEPYNASAFTCAAPSNFPFGTRITFRYRKRMVTCRVNDRGGAITGNHFDLSRAAAQSLGIINAGVVQAQYSQVGAGQTTGGDSGVTRPGGSEPQAGAGLEELYRSFLSEGQAGDTAFASFVTASGGAGKTATKFVSLPGLLGLPPIDIPGLPDFSPFDLFKHGIDAINTTQDLLKLIGWIFNPRNILRMVEFLVGISLIYIAIRINLRVFTDAASEKTERLFGKRKRGKRGKSGKSGKGGGAPFDLRVKGPKRSASLSRGTTPKAKPKAKQLGSGPKPSGGGVSGAVKSAASKAKTVAKYVPK